MAVLLREIIRNYKLYIYELSDQRTIDWPLMGSPVKVLLIVGIYLWFVLKIGPAFMKNRKPFQLDRIIQLYNLIQVGVCGYLTYNGLMQVYGPWGHYSFLCESIDFTDTEFNRFIIGQMYIYFCLKILDLMDTVFFILRKKTSQVTFLHVYHHALMVIIIWYAMRFIPGGHLIYIGLINSVVHTVMYAYYFITNYYVEYKKNLWWKKHLTQLQMFQFGSILVHIMLPFIFKPDCVYPKITVLLLLPQNFFMFVLFWDFYKKTYWQPQLATQPVKEN